MLLLPDYANIGETGIKLTQVPIQRSRSLKSIYYRLSIPVAFSSVIGNYYYGNQCGILSGGNKQVILVYKID